MNLRLVAKILGIVAFLIGATMIFSLPWAFPELGHRAEERPAELQAIELRGVLALIGSMIVCFGVGAGLYLPHRSEEVRLFRKEAMAVVGLSWVMATVLGALPYYVSITYRSAAVRLNGQNQQPQIDGHVKPPLTLRQYLAVETLYDAGARGLPERELNIRFRYRRLADRLRKIDEESQRLTDFEAEVHSVFAADVSEQERFDELDELLSAEFERQRSAMTEFERDLPPATVILENVAASDEDWAEVLVFPEEDVSAPLDRRSNYRIAWRRMGIVDALFESQSGFSTTGATVISDLEDPHLVPHCILFWRSSTHFLGGLGIVVLFVAILGQGSAGKTLMRAEMPGPSKEGSLARMQHTALLFVAIYGTLNAVLAIMLWLLGLTWFDALCHAFGTLATGGFSTYNKSVGHFDSPAIEYVILLFMFLAGTNFTLLYFLAIRQPHRLWADVEWRTYLTVILAAVFLVTTIGLFEGDFQDVRSETWVGKIFGAFRYASFQVVAIMTTTGYGTHDFDGWNDFSRGMLFLLMFVGGCAGSTGGGLKVIRHILFLKILRLEIEHAFHPRVVRPLRLGGNPVESPDLRRNILVYFSLILVIFVFSWMIVVATEPDATWGASPQNKLIDSASGVAATLNNIGPGLGTVGATQNYGHFSWYTKILFTWLMMLGRVEVFVILVLFMPSFWRSR